jgi:hypothetical protein
MQPVPKGILAEAIAPVAVMDEVVAAADAATAVVEAIIDRAMDRTVTMVAAVAANMLAASPLPNIEKCLLPTKSDCDRDDVTGILLR